MRISDWSSDVCSSDLSPLAAQTIIAARAAGQDALALSDALLTALWRDDRSIDDPAEAAAIAGSIGLDGRALVEAAPAQAATFAADSARSEERRVGKEGVSTCRSRWSPYTQKKKIHPHAQLSTLRQQ